MVSGSIRSGSRKGLTSVQQLTLLPLSKFAGHQTQFAHKEAALLFCLQMGSVLLPLSLQVVPLKAILHPVRSGISLRLAARGSGECLIRIKKRKFSEAPSSLPKFCCVEIQSATCCPLRDQDAHKLLDEALPVPPSAVGHKPPGESRRAGR